MTGCFTFCAAFFAGAGLGLAFATVRLVAFPRAALDTLRALPRAVAVFLFSALDCFLRLAMIRPVLVGGAQRIDAGSPTPSNPSNELSTDRNLSAATLALFFLGRTERSLFFERKDWDEGEGSTTSLPSFDTQRMPCVHGGGTARMGDDGKAVGCVPPTALLF